MPDPGDWPHIFDFPQTEKWRVKLCRLGEDSWNVFGEGYIRGEYESSKNEYSLVVEDENTIPSILFRTVIRSPVAFQKQDTILLWNGPEANIYYDGIDLDEWKDENDLARIAIGFQAATGCASISEFILYAASQVPADDTITFTVQHIGGNDANFEGLAELIEKPLVLPPIPNKLNLTIVLNLMKELLGSFLGREFLIVYLDAKQYLDRIWTIFEEITSSNHDSKRQTTTKRLGAEAHEKTEHSREARNHKDSGAATTIPSSGSQGGNSLENIQILWTITDIVKQYCLVGDSYLIEEMIDADRFPKVLSMLEYDRAFGTRKANFKDYYSNNTGMKQVFEITDTPVIEKIRRTFRLQLLRDVLVRSADDFAFHILRTLIFVNHSEILEKLQNSPEFCDNLFGLFDETPYQPVNQTTQTKNDAICFIYEIMKTSKTFAYSQLKLLYLTMIDSGLVNAIDYGIDPRRNDEIKMMALESLSILLEFDVSLILPFREKLVTSIMRLAAQQQHEQYSVFTLSSSHLSASSCPLALSPTTRAVLIETAEILKRLLLDLPAETMQLFFSELQRVFANSESSIAGNSTILLPFLEILTHCFSSHPDITGTLMKKHDIWHYIAGFYKASESPKNGSTSSVNGVAQIKKDHPSAQRTMALIRLVREAIQPPVVTSTIQCAEQAESIIKSGLFPTMVKHHLANYAQRTYSNDAEQSSFLNLLHTIVEGRSNTSARQFKILTDWMVNEGLTETKMLCEKYHFDSDLLPEVCDIHAEEMLPLKRAPNTQQVRNGNAGHQSQRVKIGSPQSNRQVVDEVDDDAFVLPPSSFANHFRPDSEESAEIGDHQHALFQDPSSSSHTANRQRELLAGNHFSPSSTAMPPPSSGFFESYDGFRQLSPSPPPHPWWDSTKPKNDFENSDDANERISIFRQGIHSESLNGGRH